ncbi:hypothetical protein RHGRI_027004 [Rhododendron griersonianum]|uniref:Uncharacterized protein n=1 Tax=Rhododendron griersonianum TaxID=479676 RepID=A0AAV6IUM2_9ERIC|nr:hypothetical protein RHGRI_027004 [Rhododendron griersonianum]KAG5532563.1 hypothetical protein RHGRI_027004 [Rhododendron griersonianum]
MQDSLPSLSSGILKRECAVRPFGKIDAATPEVAVASAILLADLMVASKARYRKVLPVPPGPSMKKECRRSIAEGRMASHLQGIECGGSGRFDLEHGTCRSLGGFWCTVGRELHQMK